MSDDPVGRARRLAADVRRRVHLAAMRGDTEALRAALAELYDPQASPLRATGDVNRPAAFAPMVEAFALVSRGGDEALTDEMRLNVRHTYRSFGLTEDEHDAIVAEVEKRAHSPGDDGPWCVDTCLAGTVRPDRWRSRLE